MMEWRYLPHSTILCMGKNKTPFYRMCWKKGIYFNGNGVYLCYQHAFDTKPLNTQPPTTVRMCLHNLYKWGWLKVQVMREFVKGRDNHGR